MSFDEINALLLFTFGFDFLDVLGRIHCALKEWGEGGVDGRNDARKSNDILILTNKILIVCGPPPCSPHIITLFAVVTPHSYTANDSDFRPQ